MLIGSQTEKGVGFLSVTLCRCPHGLGDSRGARLGAAPGRVEKVFYVQHFRSGLVFKAHILLYHSTLDLRVIKKRKKTCLIVSPTEKGVGVHTVKFSIERSR
jgi:hypothetical protein